MLTLRRSFCYRLTAGVQLRIVAFLRVISVACLVFMMTSPAESAGQRGPLDLTQVLQLQSEGVTVRYPQNWTAIRSANLQVLFNVPAEELGKLDAHALAKTPRITLFTERRQDHAEAVRRLKEIEAEASAPSTYLNIGGWPALQRRHLTPKPLPGQGAPTDPGNVLQITTAVAAGDLLVRLESMLPEDAPPEVAVEVEMIGQNLVFATTGNPVQVEQAIQNLRNSPRLGFPVPTPSSETSSSSGAAEASLAESAGATVAVTQQAGRDSELEIAVSPNGGNIVIGSNNGYHFSTDGGQTWNNSAGIGGNDPSLGWGQSGGMNGTFYAANIATPSTAISVSTNNGANFAFRANAYTCGQGGDPACGAAFPDQEHIAVDRFNVAAGGDQVYSAWRHLDGNWGIVCSRDSGNTWSTNGFFTGGDLPRVTVGQDGFVYVVFLNGNNITLSKFNSCENNQNPMVKAIADQTVVAGITHVACPTPGLDRCNFRNTLASPTVAVDDTNPNHIYVAYAVNTSPGGGGFPNLGTNQQQQNTANESIMVQDSTNGGSTWNAADPNRIKTVSTGVTARRFMPWVCSVGGVAHVTWYDRRAASPGGTTVSNNSLTDFFRASAFLNASGNLTAGTEFQINEPGTTDAQCEAGFATGNAGSWPSAVDQPNDSESCSLQPQLGGQCCVPGDIDGSNRCLNPTAASTLQPCDFNPDTCPAGQQCAASRGSPKYGDYNGNACGAGRLYMTWASATAPASLPASTNIDAFFSSEIICCVPQIQVPGNVAFADTCVGATSFATLDVCNTGAENLEVNSISSSNAQFAVTTPSSGFPVVISPDFCFPFQIRFTPTSAGLKTSNLTIASNDPANPSVTVQATGTGTVGDIRVTGSTDFGDVCAETQSEKTLSVCNVGACNLNVTSVAFDPACPDFTLVNNPFPAPVSPDSCLDVVIRFTPTSPGPKSCNLVITSDDPDTPIIIKTVTANTPAASIDVPPDQAFPPEVIQSLGACQTLQPFPISNTGTCDLKIINIAIGGANGGDYSLSGLPSFPIILEPGHVAGEGDLNIVFAPTALDRDRIGSLTVTYESNPITGATMDVARALCGEGVNTGARVLVREGGVPVPLVERIHLQRINANRNRDQLDTQDNARNLSLQMVTPAAPCTPFQFHREYGTVSNPIQLLPGSYQVTAAIVNAAGKHVNKVVGFDVSTCDFNPTVTIDF